MQEPSDWSASWSAMSKADTHIVDDQNLGWRAHSRWRHRDPSHPPRINMDVLPFGFTVNAELKWITRNEPTGSWNCGASLADLDSNVERAWRVVVDALPESSMR